MDQRRASQNGTHERSREMTKKNRCPDCGVGIGMPHVSECGMERCSVCGTQRITCGCEEHDSSKSVWTGEWPVPEPNKTTILLRPLDDADSDPSFTMFDVALKRLPSKEVFEKSEPEVREYSDEFLSLHYRFVHHTHLIEQVYENGEPIDEWRVFIRPRSWTYYQLENVRHPPWDAVFPSREEADKWATERLQRG